VRPQTPLKADPWRRRRGGWPSWSHLLLACAFLIPAAVRLAAAGGGVTRTYYIAADEVVWDNAPSGANAAEGRAFNEAEKPWMEAGLHVAGRKARKAIYLEYTDATFTTLKLRAPEWEHLGFLGPLVRAEVVDTVKIVFRNNAKFAAAVHPHGVFYNKDSEGANYNDGSKGGDKADDAVPTGATHTYTWEVPERAGPMAHEGSSAFWMYHPHNDEIRGVASGLIGPMIVTRKAMARPDGSPTDVDRELVAGFIEVDENHSWYVEENIQTYTTDPKGTILTRSPFGDMIVVQAPPAPGGPPLPRLRRPGSPASGRHSARGSRRPSTATPTGTPRG
jgi:manganese oxidase